MYKYYKYYYYLSINIFFDSCQVKYYYNKLIILYLYTKEVYVIIITVKEKTFLKGKGNDN